MRRRSASNLPKHLKGSALKRWVQARLEACGHACEACRRPFTPDDPPHVDHDHRTGRVRGLLCRACNTIEGMLRGANEAEKIGALHRMIAWLQRQRDEAAAWRSVTFTGRDMIVEIPALSIVLAEMQPTTVPSLAARLGCARIVVYNLLTHGVSTGAFRRVGKTWRLSE